MDDLTPTRNPNIVFIGGTGRCGTNVSKALLTNHPQVVTLPFEYRFIIDPDGIIDFYRSYSATWSPFLADARLKRLEGFLNLMAQERPWHRLVGQLIKSIDPSGKTLSPRRYHGWNLDQHLPNFKQYSQDLLAELIEFSFAAAWVGTQSYALRPRVYHAGPRSQDQLAQILGDFMRRVIQGLLDEREREFYVEDNTWNILLARELTTLLPTAKILHVYRDPRDVVASFIQQRWCPSDVKQAALWYKSIITHWFSVRADLSPQSYYEYSLEDLVHATERVVKEICGFTGIPYTPLLLEIDLSKAHSGRWQQEFSLEQQDIIHDILSEEIDKLGYKL